ncbi:RNA helicase, putative [Leishmania donovani]|uniref:RNA helicase n=1 Tax=Leishmania donovani TaxID=5661 RepID=A0A3S5H7X1_LEIDO|nr:RNA helicase, putative [Leishmania donovani]AYU82599.1 ATP-dependent RNA and DNA helicase, mitochondrial, putative [Leishmania donovani]TPP40147.1 Mitochondrial degradasome RNA helicase subunit C terminal family protein [Leishmania donovani]CBZ37722.1 RNA helicase, putative [Leishmania donovani]
MAWRRRVAAVGASWPRASPASLRFASAAPPSPLTSARQHQLHNVCDAIYRSGTAREALRQAIHEPSHESALRLLEEFEKDPGVWRDEAWTTAFLTASSHLSSQMDLLLARFTHWHTVRKAPTKVAMHKPWDWYPHARLMRRRFIFHYGPTNSGKTHAALEALMRARSGVYCAPLKALASQVWHRVKERVPCDLLIGDERVFGGAAEHVSCTVEMTPVDLPVDVGVVDEIQMMTDRDRGWAWTRALLGLPAREIHLCGEARALPLIQNLLYATHERKNLSTVEHKRLVPLTVSPSLRSRLRPETVENGDCFVCFSKKQVLDLRDNLNRLSGVTSSAIYGAMPFQVREAEAARFNRGVTEYINASASCSANAKNNAAGCSTTSSPGTRPRESSPETATPTKHVLVSTDAIAYGLNMNIERMVFTTLRKFDGKAMAELPAATVQQIAGRSGRFGLTRQHAVGRCTVLHERDMAAFRAAMSAQLEPLAKAGLLPTADILQLFAELESAKSRKAGKPTVDLSGGSFFELMSTFAASCVESHNFFPCDIHRSLLRVAELLEPVCNLSLTDRIVFCYLPLSDTSAASLQLIVAYATDHAAGKPVPLRFDVWCTELMQRAEREETCGVGASSPGQRQQQQLSVRDLATELERCFRQAEMYCWLSWRFSKTFVERERGLELKASITAALTRLNGSA